MVWEFPIIIMGMLWIKRTREISCIRETLIPHSVVDCSSERHHVSQVTPEKRAFTAFYWHKGPTGIFQSSILHPGPSTMRLDLDSPSSPWTSWLYPGHWTAWLHPGQPGYWTLWPHPGQPGHFFHTSPSYKHQQKIFNLLLILLFLIMWIIQSLICWTMENIWLWCSGTFH